MKIKTLMLVIMAFFVVSFLYAGGACWGKHGVYVNPDYDDEGIIAKCYISDVCFSSLYEKTTNLGRVGTGLLERSDKGEDYWFINIWILEELTKIT